jgi:hypothetical protein
MCPVLSGREDFKTGYEPTTSSRSEVKIARILFSSRTQRGISTRNADSERACMQARSGADSAKRTTLPGSNKLRKIYIEIDLNRCSDNRRILFSRNRHFSFPPLPFFSLSLRETVSDGQTVKVYRPQGIFYYAQRHERSYGTSTSPARGIWKVLVKIL